MNIHALQRQHGHTYTIETLVVNLGPQDTNTMEHIVKEDRGNIDTLQIQYEHRNTSSKPGAAGQ